MSFGRQEHRPVGVQNKAKVKVKGDRQCFSCQREGAHQIDQHSLETPISRTTKAQRLDEPKRVDFSLFSCFLPSLSFFLNSIFFFSKGNEGSQSMASVYGIFWPEGEWVYHQPGVG
jgi:hypothetical protein